MYIRYFKFAGVSIKVETEIPLEIIPYFAIFEKDMIPGAEIDVTYQIKQIDNPISFDQKPVYIKERMEIYLMDGVEYRQFPWWNETENHPMTLKCGSGESKIYELLLTEPQIKMFANKIHLEGYLAIERVLLSKKTFQLHASFIEKDGKAILFTAPSGTGKSTQADLWSRYEQANIMNGDKTMIKNQDGNFLACGSPYAGTSKIYQKVAVPIEAIVVLSQAPENKIVRLSKMEAFKKIYSESAINPWNGEYMLQLTVLIQELVSTVPVYYLACRPDKGAVDLLKQTLLMEKGKN